MHSAAMEIDRIIIINIKVRELFCLEVIFCPWAVAILYFPNLFISSTWTPSSQSTSRR